jgi:hypothetical protein
LNPPRELDIIKGSIDIKEADMVRTIVSLKEQDKRWLDKKAKSQNVPMTELIREAVSLLREKDSKRAAFEKALKRSAGIWTEGDGLAWQEKLRSEWR